ncbi:hypothetical protein [Microvirga pudoricolor]|uniref:hypothetical protein n=1 Tax=Microvirga pudoricolor TaxID=2778729 RepID=UPI00194F836D|nr:hypothetical protein [Microvirga pudoricolor]MBM6595848.1 hypothetical protein [Microvirga pudoricolor]
MSTVGIRNHNQVKSAGYRLEPLRENRLSVALLFLLGFATVSVMAGTQAASQPTPESPVILLQR